jgi:hypothetical protein
MLRKSRWHEYGVQTDKQDHADQGESQHAALQSSYLVSGIECPASQRDLPPILVANSLTVKAGIIKLAGCASDCPPSTLVLATFRPQFRIGRQLLQLRVLRFGLLQDGDVGVGVFPEREEGGCSEWYLVCRGQRDSRGVTRVMAWQVSESAQVTRPIPERDPGWPSHSRPGAAKVEAATRSTIPISPEKRGCGKGSEL